MNKNLQKLLLNISAEKVNSLHSEMLSDFQKANFEKYYQNPFSLRLSAIMIVLFEQDGFLKTIMIERSDNGTAHAGEISFPGGKKEPEDESIEQTAIRETYEEIGLILKKKEILASLTEVKVPVSRFTIFPFVSYVDKIPDFTLSKDEVKNVIIMDINELSKSKTIMPISIGNKKFDVPCFYYNKAIIWGASAMIINELIGKLNL